MGRPEPKTEAARSFVRQLENERRNHSEAFSTLAASYDRLAEDLAVERERRRAAEVIVFRAKSRAWFRKEAVRASG